MPALITSAFDSSTTQLIAPLEPPAGAEAKAGARSSLTGNGADLYRVYWGRRKGRLVCTVTGGGINHQSVVIVTASEGDESNSTASPQRFIGAADFTVTGIAPFDGGVRFAVQIGWDDPIPLWTDIIVMDGFPQGFVRA